jgi:hypothetical protein
MLVLLRFLHVVSIAAWLGATLWRSLTAGPDAARAFFERALRALGVDRLAGLATIATGVALILVTGVWPALPVSLMVGMTLGVARFGLTDAALRPAVRRLSARLEAGETPGTLLPAAGKLAMLSGIGHVVWLGALAGMIAAT